MTRKAISVPSAATLDAIIEALHAGKTSEALTDARKLVGGMDQRPWEQLPSRLKSAIRADVRRLISDNASEAVLRDAGYSNAIVRAVRRDLGLSG